MSQIQVRDSKGEGISLINIRLSLGNGDSDSAYDDRFTDLAGNTAWPNPLPSNAGYTLYVNERNVDTDYDSATVHVNNLNDDILIVLNELKPAIQEIHIDGDLFRDEDGHEWKMKYGSNFMLCQLVAEGIDISDRLYPGLNGFRMTGIYKTISEQAGFKAFHPKNYPNWLNSISDTFDILSHNGYYGKLDLFCDLRQLDYSIDEQKKILNDVVDMLRSKKNGFGHSLGNENDANGFYAGDFTKPNIPFATGSGLTGGPAPLSNSQAWDYQYQHLRRDEKMFIDIPPVDAPTYNLQHKLLFDETIGFADFNETGRRTSNKDWAYKMGRIMSAFNGGVIHLHHGVHSEVMPQAEQDCIDEFVRAFRS